MTTIAFRDGILAADSQETREGESSALKMPCQKLFKYPDVIFATAGETSPGMAFIEWYRWNREVLEYPEWLRERDFAILVLTPDGLFEYDGCGVAIQRTEPFYAIGTGAGYAMAAMELGASAEGAVRIAAKYDPYTGGEIKVERL